MMSSGALDAVERFSRSKFVDTIEAKLAARIVRWASRLDSFSDKTEVRLYPPEHMFDADGPFFPVIREMYSKLVIAEWLHNPHEGAVRDGVPEDIGMSATTARRSGVIKCLGPALKNVYIYLAEILDDLVNDISRFCKDLKSLKISYVFSPGGKYSTSIHHLATKFAHCLEELYVPMCPIDLRLSGCSFRKLESISLISIYDLADTILHLRNVGHCLEKVVLCDQSSPTDMAAEQAAKWKQLFEVARANCVKQCRICMSGRQMPRDD